MQGHSQNSKTFASMSSTVPGKKSAPAPKDAPKALRAPKSYTKRSSTSACMVPGSRSNLPKRYYQPSTYANTHICFVCGENFNANIEMPKTITMFDELHNGSARGVFLQGGLWQNRLSHVLDINDITPPMTRFLRTDYLCGKCARKAAYVEKSCRMKDDLIAEFHRTITHHELYPTESEVELSKKQQEKQQQLDAAEEAEEAAAAAAAAAAYAEEEYEDEL